MSDEPKGTWTLLFEPLGVLVFRDERPFDAGRHALAVSRFPLPSVFRGAVRTALFELAGADFWRKPGFGLGSKHSFLGNSECNETFALRGPLVAREVSGGFEYVLPWPQDLVVVERKKDDEGNGVLRVEIMQPRAAHERGPTCLRLGKPSQGAGRSLEPLEAALPWTKTSKLLKPRGKPWLTVEGARKYVERSSQALDPTVALVEGMDWIDQDCFIAEEKRVGIARATESGDERLVAAESMIYTLLTWRMDRRYRFAVEIDVRNPDGGGLIQPLAELVESLEGRLVRLGGKSGHAQVKVIKEPIAPSWAQPAAARAPASSKLWLWTPALYDPGQDGIEGALGDLVRLSGFDMANHQPRPLMGAVDRGAVLWFSALDHQALADEQAKRAKEHDPPTTSYGYGHWIPRSNA